MSNRKHGKHGGVAAASRPATESTAPTQLRNDLTASGSSAGTTNSTTAIASHTTTITTNTTRLPVTTTSTNVTSSALKPAISATTSGTPGPTDAVKKVIVISNKSELNRYLDVAGNKLVLIEFFADWCGPCKLLSPKLEQLAIDYADKVFVMKMDVDECEEVPMEYGVSSMPTFLFMRNKKKIELFVGSNSEKLIRKVERLCDPTKSLTSPAPSTIHLITAPTTPASNDLKQITSKKKLKTPDGTEGSTSTAAPSTTATSTAASSTATTSATPGKKAAK